MDFDRHRQTCTSPHQPAHNPWWRHQIQIFSVSLALCAGKPPVTGGFPSQRPVTRNFDVFFDLRSNKRLRKQSRWRWFETPSHSLLRRCDDSSTHILHTLLLLGPSDAIWRQRSGSTLAQVMDCCLPAPSHYYMNQCWLILRKGQWHSSDDNFIRATSAINH